jgi:hypothetical protein
VLASSPVASSGSLVDELSIGAGVNIISNGDENMNMGGSWGEYHQ